MGTQISERVEALLISCPTQTHRLTSKQPAQWDNVPGTWFLKLRNSVRQEYVAGDDCPRSQNANSAPWTHPVSLLLSQLWSVHSAPSLTSFRRLKSSSVTNMWIYFASCWLPGLVLNQNPGNKPTPWPHSALWSSLQLGCKGNAAALAEIHPGSVMLTMKRAFGHGLQQWKNINMGTPQFIFQVRIQLLDMEILLWAWKQTFLS